ncbi:MAG: hypothetical protein HOV94_28070 [Saccharothrix sp.]|nr:hypothetical protein [Saccharothrix sp.]
MRVRTTSLALWLVLALTAAACGGGRSDALDLSVTFGMVTFTIDTNGKVKISTGLQFAFGMGSVKVGASHAESLARTADATGYWVVISVPDGLGGADDHIFKIDNKGKKLVAEMNGHVVEQMELHRILVTLSPGSQLILREAPAGTSEGAPVPPLRPGVPEPFVGTWSGTLTDDGDSYPMVVTISGGDGTRPVGDVRYPRLGCAGILDLAGVDGGDQIRLTETMTENPPNESGRPTCMSPYTFTATLRPDDTVLIRIEAGAGTLTRAA